MTRSKILQYQICHMFADFKLSAIMRVIGRILFLKLDKREPTKDIPVISYGKLMYCECRWCREPGVDYD